MQVDAFGSDRDLAWVMGWGNVVESRHERWFVDRLVDAGYRVHAVELPTTTPDFQRDCVAPVREFLDGLDDPVVLAHSMGGLALAHADPDPPAVYLSPWWGMHDLPIVVEPLLALPVATPFLPISVDPEDLGGLATAADATAPNRVAPKWIQTIRAAQRSLPDLDPEDHVFYTPTDRVVDPRAIEAHAPEDQRTAYDGGHELFASERRDEYVQWVLDALPDAA
ncbi:alpha/beta hydrolase [Halorubellus sp. JP-L1]|uniref:alpha/beta fold hydrolase n=1 Tax=Halorubellus sp. JP-L1 TaxID=2715753 RepID=UPI001409B5D8|nr:alpha/beta fold hydrolase [Halorubellus sp. JP-L1]NHN41196.1 alpha/beta hydrolase [Halorubellus sp. JP-L1]